MKYEDKMEQIKKEKDALIGELKKKLSKAMTKSATDLAESVVAVEPTSHADTYASQEKLTETDGSIKTLQEKVGFSFYGFLFGCISVCVAYLDKLVLASYCWHMSLLIMV